MEGAWVFAICFLVALGGIVITVQVDAALRRNCHMEFIDKGLSPSAAMEACK